MRPANPELEKRIKEKAFELMLLKDPSEIGMRDIAKACDITPTTIYHYFKDKYTLFETVSVSYLENLKNLMQESISKETSSVEKLSNALKAFRTWCFDNPKIAMLIMTKNKIKDDATGKDVESYYVCNKFGQNLLEQAIQEGLVASKNPTLDNDIIISGLWGCIEAILLKRSSPDFWEDGIIYTDRFIELSVNSLLTKNQKSK